jgi:hypothetical protein
VCSSNRIADTALRNGRKDTFDSSIIERQQVRRRHKNIAEGVSKYHPFPSLQSYRRRPLATYTRPRSVIFMFRQTFECGPLKGKKKKDGLPYHRVRQRVTTLMSNLHRPPDVPASCSPYMLFAKPSASTPSSKSSKKHNATSKFSSCVGLTPPTCATRCWLHLLSSSAFAAILVAASDSRCTVRFVAGSTLSNMHKR